MGEWVTKKASKVFWHRQTITGNVFVE